MLVSSNSRIDRLRFFLLYSNKGIHPNLASKFLSADIDLGQWALIEELCWLFVFQNKCRLYLDLCLANVHRGLSHFSTIVVKRTESRSSGIPRQSHLASIPSVSSLHIIVKLGDIQYTSTRVNIKYMHAIYLLVLIEMAGVACVKTSLLPLA